MILEIAARLGLEGFVADLVLDHFHLQFTGFKNIHSPGFSLGNGCFVGVLLRKAPSRFSGYWSNDSSPVTCSTANKHTSDLMMHIDVSQLTVICFREVLER